MNELLHKFKLGNDAELLLEKRGGGYEKVATVPIGSQALTVRNSAQGVVFGIGGIEVSVLTADARPPAHFSDDIVVITATAPVKCGGGVLKSVTCVAGTAITLTIKDSPHDSTGRTIYTAALSAGDVAHPDEVAINGMYASFTGTATFEITVTEAL